MSRKFKKTLSRNNALYEQAVDLYLNENKPDEALHILLKHSKAGFNKAFGEIGVIIYREKHVWKKQKKGNKYLDMAEADEY